MPGFDGTGPRGAGPMTGCGGGFCVLKAPDGPRGQVVGIAGRQARPVTITAFSEKNRTLAGLRLKAMQIENMLNGVRRRIRWLEGCRGIPAAGQRG